MATLAIYRDDQFLERVQLGESSLRIGRAADNGLVLEDKNKGVSRNHAEIRYERGRYVIVDLNSQNGVWFGDRRVKVEPLPFNTPVTVGPYKLIVEGAEPRVEGKSSEDQLVPVEGGGFTEDTRLPQETGTGASTLTGASAKSGPRPRRMIAIAVGGVALAIVTVAALYWRRPNTPVQRPNPVPVPSPAVPAAQQRFQEKFDLAQKYLEQRQKESARQANEEALTILPGDRRGLAQQQEIAALEDPQPIEPPAIESPPEASENVQQPSPTERVRQPRSTLTVAPIKGESQRDRAAREKDAKTFLDDGKMRLKEGLYVIAIRLFEKALEKSNRADFGYSANETQQLIDQAREKKEQQEHDEKVKRVQSLLEQAQAREASDIVGAVQALQEAKRLDPATPGLDDRINALQQRARVEGEKAFSDARNYDARRGRSLEALASFETAVRLLELVPGAGSDLEYARKRRDELRAQR